MIVTGCLVERYLDSLKKEIPEVDKFIPIKDYDHLDLVFKDLLNSNLEFNFDFGFLQITIQRYILLTHICIQLNGASVIL